MNMNDIYAQIDDYLVGKRFDESNRIKATEIKQFICSMLMPKGISYPFPKNIYLGHFVKEHNSMSDSELLLAVLENCNEEVLLELENQFGKKSKISEIIREKIRRGSCSKGKTAESAIMTLESMLKESEHTGNKLYSLICEYMDKKGFKTDADFYNSISMSRQNFARIRNNVSNIGKETVLWIICGLGLNYIQSYQVLSTAGYAFKLSDKRDVVISYIIKNVDNYNLNMVNDVLYHFGLRTFFDR